VLGWSVVWVEDGGEIAVMQLEMETEDLMEDVMDGLGEGGVWVGSESLSLSLLM
jgi:hypothetical protein